MSNAPNHQGSVDLYHLAGGLRGCRQLSEAFYSRVQHDPVLRPLFPGKTLRCAIEAFAAFLAQFLGGPPEHAQSRWWLSLRESHQRFQIGRSERKAWMKNMVAALDELPVDPAVRQALRDLFERSSAYLVNTGQPIPEPVAAERAPGDGIHAELAQRWAEQRSLDDLVAALRFGDSNRALDLATGPTLQPRFARDRAVFAHVLSLMIRTGRLALQEYAEREVMSDPALARVHHRYGRTLLHDAAGRGNLRLVELLLRLGADPNAEVSGLHPPLYCLANECLAGGREIVHALVRAGADVDVRSDAKRCTPLHMAARRGNSQIAEALLDCGADIHAQDKTGVTPLERARNCRKAAVASLLISRGARARQ